MTNVGRLELSTAQLRRLAALWRAQESDVRSAAALLAEGADGFAPPVIAGVHQFLVAWGHEIRRQGDQAQSIAQALDAVAQTVERTDQSWAHTWSGVGAGLAGWEWTG